MKEIGCKFAWTVHISPLFWAIEQLLPCKIDKICPRPVKFSLRFSKSDRLLGVDLTLIWNIVEQHLPQMEQQIIAIAKDVGIDLNAPNTPELP